jgi:hypothetical protein
LFTPDKLFDIIASNIQFYKNPKYEVTKKTIKFNSSFFLSNLLKKKKKVFSNTFSFFKNSVYFPVYNLIKLFFSLNKKLYTIFFIRKQKFFNKGRYSRNRQLYRTGVY